MHASETLISIFFSAVPNRFNYHQASECTIYHPCFQNVLAVPNRFNYRQALECTIYHPCFQMFLQFQIVQLPSGVRMHHLPSLFSNVLAVQNRSNIVTTHALETLFSFFLCSSKYRQNALFREIVFRKFSAVANGFKHCKNACLTDIVFKIFSAVPNHFKYRQDACFRDIGFIFSLQFQIFFIIW